MTKSYPLEGNLVPIMSWTYEHDILGNRIRRNATTNNHAYPMRYDWDVLNRATLIAQPSGGASYSYRADGQRIEKVLLGWDQRPRVNTTRITQPTAQVRAILEWADGI